MIEIKSERELEKMRASGKIVAEVLAAVKPEIKPGITTLEIDQLAEDLTLKAGARPAFKGYNGFPNTLCTSLNEQVVHGIPKDRPLFEGDILSIDFGVLYDGFYGDAAFTVAVGKVSQKAEALIAAAEESLRCGIAEAKVSNRLFDISAAIQDYVEAKGYSVIRDFVGHGIGRALHEAPQVPNYGRRGTGPRLRAGMALAIEPMISSGSPEVNVLEDGWTAVTKDGSLSAHFEHSIAITEEGAVILTKADEKA